jgi:hypothetical protein
MALLLTVCAKKRGNSANNRGPIFATLLILKEQLFYTKSFENDLR